MEQEILSYLVSKIKNMLCVSEVFPQTLNLLGDYT